MRRRQIGTLSIIVFVYILLSILLNGCGEDDYESPSAFGVFVLYPEKGLPSNGGLLILVFGEPKSVDVSVGEMKGILHQINIHGVIDPYKPVYIWRPIHEMPKGRFLIDIQAVDVDGKKLPVYAEPDSAAYMINSPFEIEVVDPDYTSPMFVDSQPSHEASNVVFDPVKPFLFNLVFSEPILHFEAKAQIEPYIELSPPPYGRTGINTEYWRSTMTITVPAQSISKFSPNTKYTLIVEGIQDYEGNKAKEVKLEFTTGSW